MDDLSKLNVVAASNAGAVMTVMHPTEPRPLYRDVPDESEGAKKGATVKAPWQISLLGSDSDKFKTLSRKKAQAMIAKQNKKGSIDLEAAEKENIEIFAKVTTGWENIVHEGQLLPFSYENAVLIYRTYPFIREQIDEFIGERDNFLG